MTDDSVDQALRRALSGTPVPLASPGFEARIARRVAEARGRRRAAAFLLAWTAATAFCTGAVLASTAATAPAGAVATAVVAIATAVCVLAFAAARAVGRSAGTFDGHA